MEGGKEEKVGRREGGKIRNSFLGHWGEGDSAGGEPTSPSRGIILKG